MTVQLMSDARQEQLMKAAEATVSLMNVGVDGDAALAKVAADHEMNDHEIDLVTHAVNNSRQLAHLQTAKPEDREKPFPLIDGARVKAIKPEPTTDAELNSGSRYNIQERPSINGEAKADAPDALGIQRKIQKNAGYHVRPVVDHAAVLRDGWALPEQQKLAEYRTEHVWADVQRAQHKLAMARQEYTAARDQLNQGLDVLAEQFRRSDAPKFAEVEAAALHAGVDPALLDIIYDHAGLADFYTPRTSGAKFAGVRMYVGQQVADYVTAITKVAEAVEVAAAAQVKLADEEKDKGGIGFSGKMSPDLVSGTIQDTLGTGENPAETVQGMLGGLPTEAERPRLSPTSQSTVNQAEAQVRLKRLMGDKFISGHALPEVVDAYNAALSVNPNFGDTELSSYMKQHLATKGGVPFDLQLRAADRGRGDAE